MKYFAKYILTLFLLLQYTAQGQSNSEVTLPLTDVVKMKSKYGQEYEIYISLPPEYNASEDTFPVVYILDGDLTFGIAYNTRVLMSFGKEIPPLILVGISYSEDFENIHNNRFRDFTPTKWPAQKIFEISGVNHVHDSGGADQFLDFLVAEVKNHLNTNYRVNTDSETLVGLSLSGLFATYVALKHTKNFDKYLISSPSLWWYDGPLPKMESIKLKENEKPISIYTAIGSEESFQVMLLKWVELTSYFSQNKPEGIIFTSEMLYEETHVTNFNRALPRGLKTLFNNHKQ
ncbi:alpha/beta hydrolase [Flagellimonas meishanensis]|uniref:alpha/beta hydrolase n=1 Tax=Flagellimonas meishanensis TaxID=2873264 RepID=UPI001CA7452A|nr:alpha/beta hydrolase-fold protein [[Muricauda] meishanensis]